MILASSCYRLITLSRCSPWHNPKVKISVLDRETLAAKKFPTFLICLPFTSFHRSVVPNHGGTVLYWKMNLGSCLEWGVTVRASKKFVEVIYCQGRDCSFYSSIIYAKHYHLGCPVYEHSFRKLGKHAVVSSVCVKPLKKLKHFQTLEIFSPT